MQTPDLAIVTVPLIVLAGVGLGYRRHIRGLEDLLVAGRRVSCGRLTVAQMAAGLSASKACSVAGRAYLVGAGAIWLEFVNLAALPLLCLVNPLLRRLRLRTLADYYHPRFGATVGVLVAGFGVITCILSIAAILKAIYLTMQALGGTSPWIELVLAAIVLLGLWICWTGGQYAVIAGSAVESLTVVFLILGILGPWIHGLWQNPPPLACSCPPAAGIDHWSFWLSPEAVAALNKTAFTPLYVVMFAVALAMSQLANPVAVGLYGAGRDETTVRTSTLVAELVKRLLCVLLVLWGMALWRDHVCDPPQTGPAAPGTAMTPGRSQPAADALAGWGERTATGGLGVLLVWTCCGAVGGCAARMLAGAGLAVSQWSCLHGGKPPDEARQIRLIRMGCVPVALAGTLLAFQAESLTKIIEVLVGVPAVVSMSAWLALVWRRYNAAAFMGATAAGYLTWVIMETQLGPRLVRSFAPGLVTVIKGRLEIHDGWIILSYLSAALVTGVFIALVTPAGRTAAFDHFQSLLRRPIEGRPPHIPTGVATQAPGVTHLPTAMLVDRGNWQIPQPRRRVLFGALLAAVLSAGLIAATWLALLGLRHAASPG